MTKRGQVAIVTGGGRGIGKAAAHALATDGLAVAAVARTRPELERTVAAIRSRDGQSAAVVGDVGSAASADEIVATAEREIEPGLVRTGMSESLLSMKPTGVRTSVIRMLEHLEADPGFVDPEESAQFIRLVATGPGDDLAGEAHSIYDPSVRARVSALASDS